MLPQQISKRSDLPDLGTGVVDALSDLVDAGPLLDEDLILPHNLSTEALLEFTSGPNRYATLFELNFPHLDI